MIKGLIVSRIQELANRQRISCIALCTATNPEAPLSDRLEATRTALAQWQVDSIDHGNVVRQIPELVKLLETT